MPNSNNITTINSSQHSSIVLRSKDLLDEGNSSVHLNLTFFDHNSSNASSEPFQIKPGSELIQVIAM